jgi:hypothetical protein
MPAQSQQQQKLFGLALSVKRGETPRSEASKDVLNIVDTMSEKEIEDFAGTPHKDLPKKVEEVIRETVRTNLSESIPKMYKTFLAVQKKLRTMEDEQKKMLAQFKSEKDPKKKRSILDKMKDGTKRLQKVRANLDDIENEYINKMAYDTSYSESVNEMQVVNKKTGKDITRHVLDLLSGKIDKKKFEKLTGLKKESVNESIEPQIKKIAYFTGTRPEAVEDFVSKHALNITKLLKYVEKGGLPQRMELVSALAGRPNNPKQKKIIKQFQESVNEVNTRLNKKVKSYLDAYLKGEKKNSPEHQHAIMLIMKGALTDANFHSEARQLDKFFPKAKQSKHVGTPMEDVIEDKGVDIAGWAKWDGYDIIDAFAFYTNMNIGGGFGNKLTALKESVTETINERLNTRDMKYMDGLALRKPLDTALKELRKVGQDLIDSEGFDKGDVKEFLLSKVSRVLHVGLNESTDLNKK